MNEHDIDDRGLAPEDPAAGATQVVAEGGCPECLGIGALPSGEECPVCKGSGRATARVGGG